MSSISVNDNVFEGTILENITCKNPEISLSRILKVLEELKLSDYIRSLPNGLDTQVHSGGKQLSSSIVEKILLARCVLSNPRIIFLEEPLENVDKASSIDIIDYMTAPDKNWTLIVISKNPYWKSKSNKSFYMVNGTLKS